MNDPAGLPVYGTASPPPGPPPGRGTPIWVWFLLGGFVLVIGALAVLFAIGVALGFSSSSEEESTVEEDGYYFVDQDEVVSAVRAPCRDLQTASAQLGPVGTPEQAASRLRSVSAGMRAIASAVDTAAPDADSRAWRDDWIVLADSVEQFAEAVEADPEAQFTMPTSQGDRVSERMFLGSYECFVPVGVVALDPSPESDQNFIE